MRTALPACLVAALLLAGCAGDRSGSPRAGPEAAATPAGTLASPASAEASVAPSMLPETPATAVPPTGEASLPQVSVPAEASPPVAPAATAATAAAEEADGAPTAGPYEPAEPESLAPADWFRDPTCRHEQRWWSGFDWTSAVSDNGAAGEDPLTDADQLVTPDPDWPVDPCAEGGIMLTRFPFTAEELGCAGTDPACVLEEGELPRATRLVSHQELVDSGGYNPRLLQDLAPEGIPEDVVLGYLTECLVDWPLFPHDRLGYEGTPVQTCSMVWRYMAYPITYLGARDDLRCVWDAYQSYYLRGTGRVARYIPTGWAETCASWLDPEPQRPVPDDCRLPEGYYRRLTADDRFAEYDLTFDDPGLTAEDVRLRWCSLLARCNDLWQQVAPTRYAYFAGWTSPCFKRVSGHEINTVRKGRCEELDILASLVRAEGEAGLPTLPPLAPGLWFSC